MSDELRNLWIIPIVTSCIASIVMILLANLFGFGKRKLQSGTIKTKVKSRFNAKPLPAIIKYCLFVFIGIIPVSVNFWLLYGLLDNTSPATRSEVFSIVFITLLTTYWCWNILSKFRNYSVEDFED